MCLKIIHLKLLLHLRGGQWVKMMCTRRPLACNVYINNNLKKICISHMHSENIHFVLDGIVQSQLTNVKVQISKLNKSVLSVLGGVWRVHVSRMSWWGVLSKITINSLWSSNAIWWQITGSTLAQVMVCCLMTPSHYLKKCWLIISEGFWHSPEDNFTRIALSLSLIWVWNLLI